MYWSWEQSKYSYKYILPNTFYLVFHNSQKAILSWDRWWSSCCSDIFFWWCEVWTWLHQCHLHRCKIPKLYCKCFSQTTRQQHQLDLSYAFIWDYLIGWTVIMLLCCVSIHLTLRVILKGRSILPPKVRNHVLFLWKNLCDLLICLGKYKCNLIQPSL